MKTIGKILKEEIELIKVDSIRFKEIKTIARDFCKDLTERLKVNKINVQVFIGGSLAKRTLIKKDIQDVDVFVRFGSEYLDGEISRLLGRVVGRKGKKIHGSRDYYQVLVDGLVIEVIPVLKVSKPADAVNVTDLSYFHVNYILRQMKLKSGLGEEIMLAKTFAHACDCYGAESYINGFSGYALELLICHYGSFLKFVRAVVKMKDGEKIVIDDASFYNGSRDVLRLMDKAKLQSSIVLVDPTFKERNALAGLGKETFLKFKKYCLKFLEKPSHEFFKRHLVSEEFVGMKDVKVVEVVTSKQAGDIAGTKSKKFFRFFGRRVGKEFVVKKSGFEYDDVANVARFYFVVGVRRDEVVKGPSVSDKKNFSRFKKGRSGVFVKKGFGCVRVKYGLGFDEWFKRFVKKEKKVIGEMDVVGIEVV